MSREVRYPIGQQSFEQLRDGGFMYVDKTRFIEKIIKGSQYYFLGRPRRFGKSLFLSTLKCFFEGKRNLFKNLYIDTIDWDWEEWPVLYMDLNIRKYKTDDGLDKLLDRTFSEWEEKYDVKRVGDNLSLRFKEIIRCAAEKTGKSVVILVDEYDKPLVNNISDRNRFDMYRDLLAEVYSNFKSSADYIRLVFLTGVSRFGKLSVFSGLNNISDISLTEDYAEICGITEEELYENFEPGINELARLTGRSFKEEIEELKRHYDGYHFTAKSVDLYNPYSLLCVLSYREYGNYWIESGTPTLLVEHLKRTETDLSSLFNVETGRNSLSGLDIDNMSPVSLFYQTGYLTIKGYLSDDKIFILGIPNEEVKEGLLEYILPYYGNLHHEESHAFIYRLRKDFLNGDVGQFMKRLEMLFSGVSYEMHLEDERNVQNVLYIVFKLIGLNTDVEYRTSDGRIDILLRTSDYIYILELKYNSTPEAAFEQIIRKEYSLPWAADGREVIGIGINFSSEKRRIDGWIERRLQPKG